MEIRVAVVEDDPRYRAGLEILLTHAPNTSLRGLHPSADSLLKEARRSAAGGEGPPWDLVLMDLELPGTGGIEATRHLKSIFPGVAVIVLTVFEEPETILEAICAGAGGYLLKKTPPDELLDQIGVIAAGGAPLTSGVAKTVLDLLRGRPSRPVRHEPAGPEPAPPTRLDLTPREQEVLQCLVRGQSYKQAAATLGVSTDTIRTHIRAVYGKLQVHSVSEAVIRAIRERLV